MSSESAKNRQLYALVLEGYTFIKHMKNSDSILEMLILSKGDRPETEPYDVDEYKFEIMGNPKGTFAFHHHTCGREHEYYDSVSIYSIDDKSSANKEYYLQSIKGDIADMTKMKALVIRLEKTCADECPHSYWVMAADSPRSLTFSRRGSNNGAWEPITTVQMK